MNSRTMPREHSGTVWSNHRNDESSARRFARLAIVLAIALGGGLVAALLPGRRGGPVGVRAADSAQLEAPAQSPPEAPNTLRETGLYADWGNKRVVPENLPYEPQYPLWTDGATKRRWLRLPRGTAIDGSQPDAWIFPVGTRLWKEFSFGRRVETRYMERSANGWTFATYVWNADESDAVIAPPRGTRAATEVARGVLHAIPSAADCHACHDATQPVLGLSALQLSRDRDPNAPHAQIPDSSSVDLPALARNGLVRNLPVALLRDPPRIMARNATERAVLGYLQSNCGGCHNRRTSLASLGMVLADVPGSAEPPALTSTVGQASQFLPATWSLGAQPTRIEPGHPERSVLLLRLRSRDPATQMPPLGTQVVDEAAVALVEKWILEMAAQPRSRVEER